MQRAQYVLSRKSVQWVLKSRSHQCIGVLRAKSEHSSSLGRMGSLVAPARDARMRMFSTSEASKPKDEGTTEKKSKFGRTWKEIYEVHKDEFFNVLMAALLIILTLRMLRDKGDRLEDSKEKDQKIKQLEDELQRLKNSIKESVESGAPAVAKHFGIWSSSHPQLTAKVMELVTAGMDKASIVPPVINLVETKPVKEEAPKINEAQTTQEQKPARKGLI